uniref:Uncharacterized protein n=1 Tax=Anguilla anguilla TaxID=7936 RepID=A0A0E9VP74_ANGAN
MCLRCSMSVHPQFHSTTRLFTPFFLHLF